MSTIPKDKQCDTGARPSAAPDHREPPQYYDSEPSSQPPHYRQISGVKGTDSSIHASGASAASISAILAYPSQLEADKEKRSWRERWQEWKAQNTDPHLQSHHGSGPTLNVQGVGIKSWTSITPTNSKRRVHAAIIDITQHPLSSNRFPPDLTMAGKFFLAALAFPGMMCTALSPLSEHNSTIRIAGGITAQKGDFPYVVSMQLSRGLSHHCTGSLLDATTVLTAAHCIDDVRKRGMGASGVVVRAGSLEKSRGGVVAQVSSMFTHPSYSGNNWDNDVGILKLRKPVFLNGDSDLPLLAYERFDPDVGTMATAAGWGNTYPGDIDGSHLLQEVDIPVVSREKCDALFRQRAFKRVTESMICAGYIDDYENNKDTCSGDSGGPLIDTDTGVIVGVVSWGSAQCGGDGYVGVYASVGHLRDFIDSHME
ncbi:hypothetical protein OPT61_g3887 [Boeremia exigua]|uniref:Uncharacterized protein n=1 Tax=Boeremia exigua TaxID=749465 RepID=A0ACC2IGA8_9PLEO|nr:hypothetical protein OPT61_g3887 [Boeremia exigua]